MPRRNHRGDIHARRGPGVLVGRRHTRPETRKARVLRESGGLLREQGRCDPGRPDPPPYRLSQQIPRSHGGEGWETVPEDEEPAPGQAVRSRFDPRQDTRNPVGGGGGTRVRRRRLRRDLRIPHQDAIQEPLHARGPVFRCRGGELPACPQRKGRDHILRSGSGRIHRR